jgi:hypothetical protein
VLWLAINKTEEFWNREKGPFAWVDSSSEFLGVVMLQCVYEWKGLQMAHEQTLFMEAVCMNYAAMALEGSSCFRIGVFGSGCWHVCISLWEPCELAWNSAAIVGQLPSDLPYFWVCVPVSIRDSNLVLVCQSF